MNNPEVTNLLLLPKKGYFLTSQISSDCNCTFQLSRHRVFLSRTVQYINFKVHLSINVKYYTKMYKVNLFRYCVVFAVDKATKACLQTKDTIALTRGKNIKIFNHLITVKINIVDRLCTAWKKNWVKKTKLFAVVEFNSSPSPFVLTNIGKVSTCHIKRKTKRVKRSSHCCCVCWGRWEGEGLPANAN